MKERIEFVVRLPRIENLEEVLNSLVESGYGLTKISEPIQRGKDWYVLAVFQQTFIEAEVSA